MKNRNTYPGTTTHLLAFEILVYSRSKKDVEALPLSRGLRTLGGYVKTTSALYEILDNTAPQSSFWDGTLTHENWKFSRSRLVTESFRNLCPKKEYACTNQIPLTIKPYPVLHKDSNLDVCH